MGTGGLWAIGRHVLAAPFELRRFLRGTVPISHAQVDPKAGIGRNRPGWREFGRAPSLQGKGSLGCATLGKLPGNVIISNTEVPEGEKNLLFLGAG